jgi:serine protein kinase
MSSTDTTSMVAQIASLQDYDQYADLNWEGNFEDYLQIVRENPDVTRNAFQRVYDMMLSLRAPRVHRRQKEAGPLLASSTTCKNGGKDGIYGLDIPLMKLVNILRSAAQGYGPERRVILAAWPGGHRASRPSRADQKGPRGLLAQPPRARSTPTTGS